MFLMHTPCARITSAQGGGTSRRNARQVDPNIVPLAYHSPLCWHGLPKHRFRGRNAMKSFFQGNASMPWQGTTCAQRRQPMQKNSSPMWTGATPSVMKCNELKNAQIVHNIEVCFTLIQLRHGIWRCKNCKFKPCQTTIEECRGSLFEFHVTRGQFTLSMAGFDIGKAAKFWKSSTMVPGGYRQFCLTPMLLHEWAEPTFQFGCCHSLRIHSIEETAVVTDIWSCWMLRQVTPGNTWETLVLQAWCTEPRWARVKSHCAQVGCIGIRKLRRGSWGLRGADLLERSLSETSMENLFGIHFMFFVFTADWPAIRTGINSFSLVS